jgi:hypothetical protein
MIKKSRIGLLLALFLIAWSPQLYSGGFNPDGRHFQPGMEISYGRSSGENNGMAQYQLSLDLPISDHFTFLSYFGYLNLDQGSPKSGNIVLIGMNYYSKSILSLSELSNPDGKQGSIVLGILAGENHMSEGHSGLNSAITCGYISGNRSTVVVSYAYSRIDQKFTQTLLLGLRLHSGGNDLTQEMVNPDGRIGSNTVFPSAGGIFTERESGYAFGLGMISALTKLLSFRAEYLHMAMKVYSLDSFSVGLTFYF